MTMRFYFQIISTIASVFIISRVYAQEAMNDSTSEYDMMRIIDTIDIDYGAKHYTIIRKDPRKDKFIGHWNGIEIGRNGFMNDHNVSKVPDELSFISLNRSKSWNVNINFVQINIGLYDDKIGLVTGLGAEFSNYRLSGKNLFYATEEDGFKEIEFHDSIGVTKSKFTTSFLVVPLLFEIQFPDIKRRKRMYFSFGALAGGNITAHTKLLYEDNYIVKKKKDYNTYNLNLIRYGVTARLGYRIFDGFINYYFTPLFKEAENIYPVYIGFRLELKRFL